MKIYKAPEKVNNEDKNKFKIFLAGSIEMGKAVNWQDFIVKPLKDYDIVILNPRRDDWDSSWKQEFENKQFREQVEWELGMLEIADAIILYFDPKTKSPISLLELGIHSKDGKLIVYCPDGFWRKGNVDIVCHKYKIDQAGSWSDVIEYIAYRYLAFKK